MALYVAVFDAMMVLVWTVNYILLTMKIKTRKNYTKPIYRFPLSYYGKIFDHDGEGRGYDGRPSAGQSSAPGYSGVSTRSGNRVYSRVHLALMLVLYLTSNARTAEAMPNPCSQAFEGNLRAGGMTLQGKQTLTLIIDTLSVAVRKTKKGCGLTGIRLYQVDSEYCSPEGHAEKKFSKIGTRTPTPLYTKREWIPPDHTERSYTHIFNCKIYQHEIYIKSQGHIFPYHHLVVENIVKLDRMQDAGCIVKIIHTYFSTDILYDMKLDFWRVCKFVKKIYLVDIMVIYNYMLVDFVCIFVKVESNEFGVRSDSSYGCWGRRMLEPMLRAKKLTMLYNMLLANDIVDSGLDIVICNVENPGLKSLLKLMNHDLSTGLKFMGQAQRSSTWLQYKDQDYSSGSWPKLMAQEQGSSSKVVLMVQCRGSCLYLKLIYQYHGPTAWLKLVTKTNNSSLWSRNLTKTQNPRSWFEYMDRAHGSSSRHKHMAQAHSSRTWFKVQVNGSRAWFMFIARDHRANSWLELMTQNRGLSSRLNDRHTYTNDPAVSKSKHIVYNRLGINYLVLNPNIGIYIQSYLKQLTGDYTSWHHGQCTTHPGLPRVMLSLLSGNQTHRLNSSLSRISTTRKGNRIRRLSPWFKKQDVNPFENILADSRLDFPKSPYTTLFYFNKLLVVFLVIMVIYLEYFINHLIYLGIILGSSSGAILGLKRSMGCTLFVIDYVFATIYDSYPDSFQLLVSLIVIEWMWAVVKLLYSLMIHAVDKVPAAVVSGAIYFWPTICVFSKCCPHNRKSPLAYVLARITRAVSRIIGKNTSTSAAPPVVTPSVKRKNRNSNGKSPLVNVLARITRAVSRIIGKKASTSSAPLVVTPSVKRKNRIGWKGRQRKKAKIKDGDEVKVVDVSATNPISDDRVITMTCFNARGLKGNPKFYATKTRTIGDDLVGIMETNLRTNDAQLLVNKGLGMSARIAACDKISYDNRGNRTSVASKKSGFGTALISRKNDLIKYIHVDSEFEIIFGRVTIGKVTGLVITIYRSPSMSKRDEIERFYRVLCNKSAEFGGLKENDFILYAGDDNCVHSDARLKNVCDAQNLFAETFQMINLIGDIPTRGKRQPDSCLAYFNPLKVDICAMVQAKIHGDMDHYPIIIHIRALGVEPKMPSYKIIERNKLVWSDEMIEKYFEEKFAIWMKKWSFATKPIAEIVEKMTNDFERIISELRRKAWKLVPVCIPQDVPDDNRDRLVVKIAQEKTKLQKIAFKIRDSLDPLPLRKEYVDTMNIFMKYSREKALKDIEKDYEKQKTSEVTTSYYFYKTIKLLTGKESFCSNPDGPPTEDQIKKRLDENDATFISDTVQDKLDFLDETPTEQYELADDDTLKNIIKGTKKIEDLFGKHTDALSAPIIHLANAIQDAQHYPRAYRISKLTLLLKRAIFSLGAMPKIIERLFYNAFQQNIKSDYIKKGDPLQMAYEVGRGVVSCNAITLVEVEKSLKNGKPAIQVYMDLKKAFNRVNRYTAIKQIHKICGAGKLVASWFKDRVYKYRDEIRGSEFNCGVPAGTLLGVALFKVFIVTDRAMTAFNKTLLWASGYSDDRSPLCDITNIRNGNLQKALDESAEWAKDQGCEYHLKGDKRPLMLCFENKDSEKLTDKDKSVKLCGEPIEIASEVTILGLNIVTGKKGSTPEECKLIKLFGYVLRPDINTIKTLAYRIRSVAFDTIPKMRQLMVASQLGGKLRFASSLMYLRATEAALKKLRFYHGLAAASVCGLSAYEVLGASCCKYQSVTCSNEQYIKLLDLCNLPTLRDMSIIDARATIRQLVNLKPEWFKRLDGLSTMEMKDGLPTYCNPKLHDNLISELLDLAKAKTRVELKVVTTDMNHEDVWTKTKSMCLECDGNKRQTELCLYSDYMRYELNCLNANHRRLGYLTPTKQLIKHTPEQCQTRPLDHVGAKCGPTRVTRMALATNSVEVVYIRDKCLICGDLGPKGTWTPNNESLDESRWGESACPKLWTRCHHNCGFGAHNKCIRDLKSLKIIISPNKKFCCNQVLIQLKRTELMQLTRKSLVEQEGIIEKRKKARITKLGKRKRGEDRYINDLTACPRCGNLYDLHVQDHLLNDCPYFGYPRMTESNGPPKKRLCNNEQWVNPDTWDRLYYFVSHKTP